MAPSFSVSFNETFSANYPAAPSTGSWVYEYPRHRWRADHNAPQTNNFCSCVSNTTDSCALIFVPPDESPNARGGLFVDYTDHPELCCFLCDDATGCSPIAPDWLSANPNATHVGLDDAGCDAWCAPGDSASADCLSTPAPGSRTPCTYFESYNLGPGSVITHNLSFAQDSYREGPQSDAAFALRAECAKDCPRAFPAQCG